MSALPLNRGGFARWLRECYERLGLHGAHCTDAMIDHAAGRYWVSSHDSDRDLRRAEALGWIRRGKFQPTHSQRALTLYGLVLSKLSEEELKRYASCWYWEPAKYGTPEHTAAQAWLDTTAGEERAA